MTCTQVKGDAQKQFGEGLSLWIYVDILWRLNVDKMHECRDNRMELGKEKTQEAIPI